MENGQESGTDSLLLVSRSKESDWYVSSRWSKDVKNQLLTCVLVRPSQLLIGETLDDRGNYNKNDRTELSVRE